MRPSTSGCCRSFTPQVLAVFLCVTSAWHAQCLQSALLDGRVRIARPSAILALGRLVAPQVHRWRAHSATMGLLPIPPARFQPQTAHVSVSDCLSRHMLAGCKAWVKPAQPGASIKELCMCVCSAMPNYEKSSHPVNLCCERPFELCSDTLSSSFQHRLS